jgi:hypothetical protein
MKLHNQIILLLFLTCLATSACTQSHPEISDSLVMAFRDLIEIDSLNESFQISADTSNPKKLMYGSDVSIVFKNISGDEVFFPVGYGIRLFIIRDKTWVEIPNKNVYYGDGSWLQTRSDELLGARLGTWVRPVLPPGVDAAGQDVLRIVVVGEIPSDQNKTGSYTAAYVDVFISP